MKSIRYVPGLSVILLAVNGKIDGLAAWRFGLKYIVAAGVQIDTWQSVRSTPQGVCWRVVCCRLWTTWVYLVAAEDHGGALMLDGRAWVMMMANTRNVGHGNRTPYFDSFSPSHRL